MKDRFHDKTELTDRLLQVINPDTAAEPSLREKIDAILYDFFSHDDQAARDSEVTILLSDIRGFTAISERYQAIEVVNMLNHYFSRMNSIIVKYGGMIDKYMGDSIMVLFGVPEPKDDDILRAIVCAVEMQIAMDDVNHANSGIGLPDLYMGIGINTGSVSAGQLGSDLHREYSVIGDGVNLASRIESHSLRGQILISEYTYERVKAKLEIGKINQVRVKGKSEPITLYEVVAVYWPEMIAVPRREIRTSARVEVDAPFRFQFIADKVILPAVHTARMKDISYYGLFATLQDEPELLSNIKLTLSLSILGGETRDIYAKITSVRPMDTGYGCGIEFTSIEPESQATIKEFVDRILEGS